MKELRVKAHETGREAQEWLRQQLPGVPAGYLRQLLRRGQICRGGLPLRADQPLAAGDCIALPANRRLDQLLAAPLPGPEILLETPEALIVAKPAGLAVHRGVGHETDHLGERLDLLLRQRRAPYRCAPIHRLDAATSGPLLYGKGRRAIAAFGEVFRDGPTSKRYLALVRDGLPPSGWLETPVPVRGRYREAATRFRLLGAAAGFALLELELLTGRRHQLRRQLADAGHPIAGDGRYRGPGPQGLERLFLHCQRLEVGNPFGDRPLVAELALPPELTDLLERLGLPQPHTNDHS